MQAERSLLKDNLLGVFAPLLVHVCSRPKAFPSPRLQSNAVLALCKCMCVSEDFCDRQLQLLFTLLETSTEPRTRADIVIALGDMAFRFPNTLEPWSQHIYQRLKDSDPVVRKHALMVLTHLILNDMMKIKGCISEMALCLRDPEPDISGLAKLFFHELANKGKNPVYNILPDAIRCVIKCCQLSLC